MNFLTKDNIDNYDFPVDFSELKNSDHLRYLYTTVAKFSQDKASIHFLLAEEYEILIGYLPFILLLQNRVNEFENYFGSPPAIFNKAWKVEVRQDLGKLYLIRRGDSAQSKWSDINCFMLSLLPKFSNLKLQQANTSERPLHLDPNQLFTKFYSDNVSVILFSSSTAQENALLRRHLNKISCLHLFHQSRIDYNNIWDGKGGLIKSRLSCLEEVGLFTDLHARAPVNCIIVTNEALSSYLSQIVLPEEEDNIENRLQLFFNQLTAFATGLGSPPVILTASADKCLLFRQNVELLRNQTDLNGYTLGSRAIILQQDFTNSFDNIQLIKPILRYQDKDNILSNCLYQLQNRLKELAVRSLDAGRLNRARTIVEQLKSLILSRLPNASEIQNCLQLLHKEICLLRLSQDDDSAIASIISSLMARCIYFQQLYETELEAIEGYIIRIYSDNPNDYVRQKNRNWDVYPKDVVVQQLNWTKISDSDNETQQTNIYTFTLPEKFINSTVYCGIFQLISTNTQNRRYILLSKKDLLLVHKIIAAFEHSVHFFRSSNETTIQVPVIDRNQIVKQTKLARTDIVDNIDDLIQQSMHTIQRKAIGVARIADSNNNNETVNITCIDHFNENQIITLFDVPAGRLFDIIEECSEDDKNGIENRKKRADELEQGDQILQIFNNRDSTYEELRELLRERNTKGFRDKYERGQVWIDVLSRYREHVKAITGPSFRMTDVVDLLVTDGMVRVTTVTVNKWIQKGNVFPDNFKELIDAIKKLIKENQDIFPEEYHRIGSTSSYMDMYKEVWTTPRMLYRSIVRNIKNQEDLDFSIMQYEEIFRDLLKTSRILTVQIVD